MAERSEAPKKIQVRGARVLNYDNIPNFKKIDPEYVDPDYDPQNAYTVPLHSPIVPVKFQLILPHKPDRKMPA